MFIVLDWGRIFRCLWNSFAFYRPQESKFAYWCQTSGLDNEKFWCILGNRLHQIFSLSKSDNWVCRLVSRMLISSSSSGVMYPVCAGCLAAAILYLLSLVCYIAKIPASTVSSISPIRDRRHVLVSGLGVPIVCVLASRNVSTPNKMAASLTLAHGFWSLCWEEVFWHLLCADDESSGLCSKRCSSHKYGRWIKTFQPRSLGGAFF